MITDIHDIINIMLTVFMIYNASKYYKLKPTEAFSINDWFKDLIKKMFLNDRDIKTIENPLYPPEQRVEEKQYPYPNNSLWEKTRGEPDDYQLVGLLYNKDINKNYQLYGRRVYPGAYEWEYYILGRDVGGLEIKLPIQIQNKSEIMDGTQLTIPIDSNIYTVTIYNYSTPRYNPYPFSVVNGQYVPTDYGKA